ncbi:hypothetical protein AB0A05_27395 [Streptomyces sp. NPDC046374]|uniref:hypothetical protein n=1 Tax=Streptomyces sp. NPDC046374 TaxID=3154917 RepID=UPI0033F666D5
MGCCGRTTGCTCAIEGTPPISVVDLGGGKFTIGLSGSGFAVGGSLTGGDTPAPSTPAAVPLVAGSPLTGMTVTDGKFTSDVTALWVIGGTLTFTTNYAQAYVMDVDVWLSWQESGQTVTSALAAGSGQIGAGNVLRVPVTLSARLLAGHPVTLMVQTFGRTVNDPNVKLTTDLVASQLLEDKSPPTDAPASVQPTGVVYSGAGPVAQADVPYDGTDTLMRWQGDYSDADAYKRGATVTYDNATWVARVDRPDGAPAAGLTGWALLPAVGSSSSGAWSWKGSWATGTTYPAGSGVRGEGGAYYAPEDIPADLAPPDAPWQLVVPNGKDGERGPGGPRGEQGPRGLPGERGPQGAPGADGRTVLSGDQPPLPTTGQDGDFYIHFAADTSGTVPLLYGPKGDPVAGQWPPNPVPLKGPKGDKGDKGPAGADGRTILSGDDAPLPSTGADGDFYIRFANDGTGIVPQLYGPKGDPVPGEWPPSPVILKGPKGDKGDKGDPGSGGGFVYQGISVGAEAWRSMQSGDSQRVMTWKLLTGTAVPAQVGVSISADKQQLVLAAGAGGLWQVTLDLMIDSPAGTVDAGGVFRLFVSGTLYRTIFATVHDQGDVSDAAAVNVPTSYSRPHSVQLVLADGDTLKVTMQAQDGEMKLAGALTAIRLAELTTTTGGA